MNKTPRGRLQELKNKGKVHTGKKVKYQFWNNTGVSVVLYWSIIGMFTRIPTLEK